MTPRNVRDPGSGGSVTGGWVTTGRDAAVTVDATVGIHTVAFHYTATAGVTRDAVTQVSISTPAETGTLVVDLEFTGNGWILREMRSPTG